MIPITTFRLTNGLRVVHNYDDTTAMVAVNVLYDTGSRDERASLTGLAHLMEHLMFAGSENVPDFDAEIERAGGTDNAWTSIDFTDFHEVAPAVNFETLIFLEADRMERLRLTQENLDVQRAVVIEEFKQTCLSGPYGDTDHHLRPLLFTRHPYAHPTIGAAIDHLEKVTLKDILDFYRARYSPSNAVLAISGNVTAARVREAVEQWFAPLEGRPVAERPVIRESLPAHPRRKVVRGNVPHARLTVAFPMGGYGDPDYCEADLITDILASGNSSRFYRRLVMGSPLFIMADAAITGSEDPGHLMLRAELTDASDEAVAEAERMLVGEALKLGRVASEKHPDGVDTRQLDRAKNRHASQTAFSLVSCADRALTLAMAEMHGEDINRQEERYEAVTVDSLARAARTIIDPSRASTLVYLPDR